MILDYVEVNSSRSRKRRERLRRTAVRKSMLASVELRDLIVSTSKPSLRFIVSMFPLPRTCYPDEIDASCHTDDYSSVAFEQYFSGLPTVLSSARFTNDGNMDGNTDQRRQVTTDIHQPTTLQGPDYGIAFSYAQLFSQGRVDPTARVEAQGPVGSGDFYVGQRPSSDERQPTTKKSHDEYSLRQIDSCSQFTEAVVVNKRFINMQSSWLDLLRNSS